MKILIIITFYLMSGPVHCIEVMGYPGGRVIIDSKRPVNPSSTVYFCIMKTECPDLITARATDSVVHNGRFTLFKAGGVSSLIFRNLSLQDTGLYNYGENGVWSENINLNVKSDPCCNETKSVTGYLGETVMISCSYPTEFERYIKSFYKLNNYTGTELILTRAKESYQDGRFSISDDGRSNVFSVNISDVREDDGGVYSCAVNIERTEVSYYSLFTEIQLQVTEDSAVTPGSAQVPVFINIIIIIIISVCVTVLLMGGFLLFYQLRRNKTQDSTFVSQQTEANIMTADYENAPPQSQNNIMHLDSQNLNPNTSQSDSVYQTLDPNTKQSDSVYQTLNPNTNQSDSGYQTLDPNTKQSDSVYQTLNPNTNQSDSGYQNLDPNTKQSNSVYQTLDPNTNQSDSGYQNLDPNTKQSNSVYQTLDPNTKQSNSVYQTLHPTISQIQSTRV